MSAVLIWGLLLRERRGVGGIGLESVLVAGLYLAGVAVLLLSGVGVEATGD